MRRRTDGGPTALNKGSVPEHTSPHAAAVLHGKLFFSFCSFSVSARRRSALAAHRNMRRADSRTKDFPEERELTNANSNNEMFGEEMNMRLLCATLCLRRNRTAANGAMALMANCRRSSGGARCHRIGRFGVEFPPRSVSQPVQRAFTLLGRFARN